MVGPLRNLGPGLADSSTATCLSKEVIIARVIIVTAVRGRGGPGEAEA